MDYISGEEANGCVGKGLLRRRTMIVQVGGAGW